MFIGHYGPGFAVKAAAPRAPMWALLAAVQIMDIFWGAFIHLGVEHAHIDPVAGLAGSALILDDMPYTHSLLGAAIICAAFALLVRACVRGGGLSVIVWVMIAGMSHWALDLLVHAPDMTIAGAPPKLGFGLWAYRWPEFALEVALVLAGVALYVRATTPRGPIGAMAPWLVAALLLALGAIEKLRPTPLHPPADAIMAATTTALCVYAVLIACGAFLDLVRAPRAPHAAARASSAA